jgi:hypothetical protein
MIPVVALAGCAAGLTVAPFMPMLASLALLYPVACLTWGVTQMIGRRDSRLIAGGPALMTMHLSWALGFLVGLARATQVTSVTILPTQVASVTIPPAIAIGVSALP